MRTQGAKLLSVFLLVFAVREASAQLYEIPIKFQIDGKTTGSHAQIYFVVGGKVIRAKRHHQAIVVPKEVLSSDHVAVKIVWKNSKMLFDDILPGDLNASWTVGIDNRPFERDTYNVNFPYSDARQVYLLEVRPNEVGFGKVFIVKP